MKKSVYIIGLAVILVLVVALLLMDGGSNDAAEGNSQRPNLVQSAETWVTVYYLTEDGRWLLPLSISSSSADLQRAALEWLLTEPPTEQAAQIFFDVGLINVYHEDDIVYVDLTDEFLKFSAAYANVGVQALCATVLPLSNCKQMQLLVEGKVVEQVGNVNISQPISDYAINADDGWHSGLVKLVYYLADAESGWLIPHTTGYEAGSQYESKEQLQLLAAKTLPAAISLNDCWRSEDVAGFDLHFDLAELEVLAPHLQALVYGACGIEDVNSVSILLDGEKVDLSAAVDLQANSPLNKVTGR